VTGVVGEGALGTTHSGRDALGFAIHDLKHMEKFVDPEFHLEQVWRGPQWVIATAYSTEGFAVVPGGLCTCECTGAL
jgi:hypothetical protein